MKIMKVLSLLIFTAFLSTALIAQQKTTFNFSFGPKKVPGYIKVDPSVKYSEEMGYGFDFGTTPVIITPGN